MAQHFRPVESAIPTRQSKTHNHGIAPKVSRVANEVTGLISRSKMLTNSARPKRLREPFLRFEIKQLKASWIRNYLL